jgi:hypothetical protein
MDRKPLAPAQRGLGKAIGAVLGKSAHPRCPLTLILVPMPKKKVTKAATRRKSFTTSRLSSDHLTDLIDASARAFELTIESTWKPTVRANLRVIFAQAALFMAFELPDDAEPAPIFKA